MTPPAELHPSDARDFVMPVRPALDLPGAMPLRHLVGVEHGVPGAVLGGFAGHLRFQGDAGDPRSQVVSGGGVLLVQPVMAALFGVGVGVFQEVSHACTPSSDAHGR